MERDGSDRISAWSRAGRRRDSRGERGSPRAGGKGGRGAMVFRVGRTNLVEGKGEDLREESEVAGERVLELRGERGEDDGGVEGALDRSHVLGHRPLEVGGVVKPRVERRARGRATVHPPSRRLHLRLRGLQGGIAAVTLEGALALARGDLALRLHPDGRALLLLREVRGRGRAHVSAVRHLSLRSRDKRRRPDCCPFRSVRAGVPAVRAGRRGVCGGCRRGLRLLVSWLGRVDKIRDRDLRLQTRPSTRVRDPRIRLERDQI